MHYKHTYNLLVSSVLACVLLLFAGSCATESFEGGDGSKGTIALRIGVDGSVTDAIPHTKSSQASIIPQVSDFNLKLTKTDGSYTGAWGSLGEFPADKQFNTGAYTMEAYYGAMDYEGFNAPYYYGIADFHVVEGESAEVMVTASLANSMVSIDYTDAFRSFFKEYGARVHSAGGAYIDFTSDEDAPAYLRPGDVTLSVNVTKQNGLGANIEAATFQALPKHHYHVTLDVNNGQTGEGVISVIFDDTIDTEDVEIDISDAILLMPGPSLTAKGFTPDQTLSVVEGIANGQTSIVINAPGALRSVRLTTQSTELLPKGFPAEIDLMAATPAQQELLASFGLQTKGLFNKPDKMAIIEFAELFTKLLSNTDHNFTVVAIDKMGKTSDPVSLKVKSRTVGIGIVSLPDIYIDDTQAEMTVSFDGDDFATQATVQLQTPAGDWITPRILSTTPQGGNVKVTFEVPADYTDFPVRIKYGDTVKSSATLHKKGVLLSVSSVDVWATHATLSYVKNVDVSPSDLTFYISTDEANYTQATASVNASAGTVTLTGLTPGTTLHVKASDTGSIAGAYRPLSIATEAAIQPQGGNMNTWGKDQGWKKTVVYGNTVYKYWPGNYENEYWATRNDLTCGDTSYGYASVWYNFYSGTYNVAGLNNTNAAEICTVGWAKTAANTFVLPSTGNVNTRSAGYLFMGSYSYDKANDTENFEFGRPFTSRPTALSFWYKFTSCDSESFKAYVVVENRNGSTVTELGRGQLISGEDKSTFTKATVNIDYKVKNLKATHAYVVFVSSDSDAPRTKHVQGSKGAFAGYTDARHTGNVLVVDDIEFTY